MPIILKLWCKLTVSAVSIAYHDIKEDLKIATNQSGIRGEIKILRERHPRLTACEF